MLDKIWLWVTAALATVAIWLRLVVLKERNKDVNEKNAKLREAIEIRRSLDAQLTRQQAEHRDELKNIDPKKRDHFERDDD